MSASPLVVLPTTTPVKAGRTGVLLVNLGTPDAPRTAEVRKYLAEFLSDPRVLDINPIARWLLLNLVILRKRPAESAEAYEKVWGAEGSPLLVHSRHLEKGVDIELGEDFVVELAMRYGEPSLSQGLERLVAADVERIVILPLYPQYASASTGSTLEAVYAWAAKQPGVVPLVVVPPFFDHPAYIRSVVEVSAPVLEDFKPDYVLFSYHGIPERQVKATDPSKLHCLQKDTCCDELGPNNRLCYRAHCLATTRAVSAALNLGPDDHGVAFQSRLGRTPWLKPYTDYVLTELAQKGVKRLAVLSPAFVADCLETLEELAIRADEDFRAAGGEELRLVPSLNSEPVWIKAVAELVRDQLS